MSGSAATICTSMPPTVAEPRAGETELVALGKDVDQLGILASSTASSRIRYARLRTRNIYRRRCIHMVAVSTALHCLDIHRSCTLSTLADACVLCPARTAPTATRVADTEATTVSLPPPLSTSPGGGAIWSTSAARRPAAAPDSHLPNLRLVRIMRAAPTPGALRRLVRRRRGPTQILPVLLSINLAIRNTSSPPPAMPPPHPSTSAAPPALGAGTAAAVRPPEAKGKCAASASASAFPTCASLPAVREQIRGTPPAPPVLTFARARRRAGVGKV
ncbi:hypothetical protein DFH08DRAFT_964735 [Mycena albidolilacea]|uniref:Uncharacterized protein n=1 Tax=Mycena albidolilacea TaxID=1033008 RepID=A0AAD7ELV2_9AGAR|nr:hypothetical protein DFH08DRAFT_964735 [Mycena albidolilacea]